MSGTEPPRLTDLQLYHSGELGFKVAEIIRKLFILNGLANRLAGMAKYLTMVVGKSIPLWLDSEVFFQSGPRFLHQRSRPRLRKNAAI
jgi:hypothetical protein